jgi:outer membrane protein assembly factor BamB
MYQNNTRRSLLTTVGVTLTVGCANAPPRKTPTTEWTDEWPKFGYNTANTSHAPINTGPDNLREGPWTFQCGDEVWSSVSVKNDTIYISSWDGNLYALSIYQGNEEWRFETDGEIHSTPTVKDDTVYIGNRDKFGDTPT